MRIKNYPHIHYMRIKPTYKYIEQRSGSRSLPRKQETAVRRTTVTPILCWLTAWCLASSSSQAGTDRTMGPAGLYWLPSSSPTDIPLRPRFSGPNKSLKGWRSVLQSNTDYAGHTKGQSVQESPRQASLGIQVTGRRRRGTHTRQAIPAVV